MRYQFLKETTPEQDALLRATAEMDMATAGAAYSELVTALSLPLQQGILNGDIIGGIFEPIPFGPGQSVEFPLDIIQPSAVKDLVAYTIPNIGRIPEKHVEGDMVMVPTYDVGASIDWSLKYNENARWDVVGRAMQVLEAMFRRKANNDGWHTLIASGKSRNLVAYDDQAAAGLFTKRLVAVMEAYLTRNAGGNSTSEGMGELTDLFLSLEAHQDVLSWDLTQVPDGIRQQIYLNWQQGGVARIGRVNLHRLFELGVGQEYQKYYDTTLGGTLPGSKVELAIGLDLKNRWSFVMPVRKEVRVFEDMSMHRARRAGLYAFGEHGFASLDNRVVLLGGV